MKRNGSIKHDSELWKWTIPEIVHTLEALEDEEGGIDENAFQKAKDWHSLSPAEKLRRR